MEDLRAMHIAMAATQPQLGTQRDEWEEWTDDEAPTPRADDFPAPLAVPGFSSSSKTQTSTAQRSSKPRQSTMRIQRLKSRKRQKDQNAKAGIRLVTDMTRFRKGPQHAVQLVKPAPGPHSSHPATGKFSDASALRALEGSPNPGSVGNWAWLKNSPSTASVSTFQGETTPDSSKIVIGISLPEDDAAGKDISPQTAVVATPFDRLPFNKPSTNPFHNQQPKSAWSPDTEDSFSPARHLRSTSGASSQATSATPGQPGVPPVPALPLSLKNPARARLSRSDFDDDSDTTPITLFEEDGHKTPASATSKLSPGAMTATSARSGWWDHLTTPFRERFSPTSKSDKEAPSPAADEWWKGQDEKKSVGAAHIENHPAYSAASASSATLRPHPSPVPIIRVPTPTIASSSSSGASTHTPGHEGESRSEKARAMMEEGQGNDAPAEMPPPYERTPSTKQPKPVRFRAVFPPGHELSNAYPPSPLPGSPGLDGTMTSQGAIKMSDVPLTPALGTSSPLPERKPGTYATGDHFLANYGNDPAAKIERTRRRHEKEDYVAHRAGGFWRGRGCVPENGCYGRSGREGRQRRRVWIGAICLALLLLTTLGVVLGVVLSRRMARGPDGDTTPTTTSGSTGGSEIANTWLNLTDFPPMPTGLSTIVAPDNSQIVNGCAAPSTLWSCSLPPEQQAANEPSDADQPGFIFQIQYDNNTRQLWNMPNGTPPTPTQPQASPSSKASASSTASSTSASATNSLQGGDLSNPSSSPGKRAITLYDTGIAPNPDPPSFQEMWFLGNTTDGIVSDDKAGEPTPFYISFFANTSGSAGPDMLRSDGGAERRGIGNGIGSGTDSTGSLSDLLPPPPLRADGTGAPAQLRPYPFQQPLRLFDRGLPTEHYGFYTYFNKTIYVTSMDGNDTSGAVVAADAGGGSREGAARFLVSWTQTRFVVKIWTRRGGAARLMGASGGPAAADAGGLAAMPGTFPYPVTVGEDTHGGSVDLKATFAYGLEPDRRVNTTDATLFANDVGFGGSAVNPRLPNGDLSWGGVDGGTGGCRCEWVNWVEA